jgi:ABC-type spermidine/putrescine transport system permease subunit I
VAIGFVYSFLPFMVLPIYTSLEKMDWRLVEAAFDLGANRWQALRRVILPLAMPGMVAGCLLVFIPAIGSYYIPELLGGGKSLMIGNLIQNQFGTARNWPFGPPCPSCCWRWCCWRCGFTPGASSALRENDMQASNTLWRFRGVTPTAMLAFVYLYLPIVVLVVLSFNANRIATLWTGFSFDWYLKVMDNDNILRATKTR